MKYFIIYIFRQQALSFVFYTVSGVLQLSAFLFGFVNQNLKGDNNMGVQLSLSIEENHFCITYKDAHVEVKEEGRGIRSAAISDPFREAYYKYLGNIVGEQLELNLNFKEDKLMFQTIVEKMTVGNKYTMLMFDDLTGFPYGMQFTLIDIDVKPYAQYPEALYIEFRAFRHRSNQEIVFLPDKRFIIWENHVKVETSKWGHEVKASELVSIKRSKYDKFDEKYLTDGVNSTKQEPFIVYIPEYAIT